MERMFCDVYGDGYAVLIGDGDEDGFYQEENVLEHNYFDEGMNNYEKNVTAIRAVRRIWESRELDENPDGPGYIYDPFRNNLLPMTALEESCLKEMMAAS